MSVITPDPAISERWRATREVSELRKPFDLFLAAQDIQQGATSVDRDTVLIARAATFILHTGYAGFIRNYKGPHTMTNRRATMLTRMCFSMAEALSELIGKREHAQVAATIVARHALAPRLGEAATAKLTIEGMMWCCLKRQESMTNICLREIGRQAARAVARNNQEQLDLVSESIQDMLAYAAESAPPASG